MTPPVGTVGRASQPARGPAGTVTFRAVRGLRGGMTDEPEPEREVSSLPGRTLQESEVESLSADRDGSTLSPASMRVDDPPEVTSVFIDREGRLEVAGFSPREGAWFVYGRWSDREKSDPAIYELVARWDARYHRERIAERR